MPAVRQVGARRLRLRSSAVILIVATFALLWAFAAPLSARAVSRLVLVANLEGPIDQVTARYISRAIDSAEKDGAAVLVIRLNTPGGLLDSTRDIVRDIFNSQVPVVVYVAPSGSRAASAGTFIAAAAGVAAMAPTTNIGAASPVGAGGEDLPKTSERKAREDAAAFLRSIAERRGRNAEALEATVLDAKAYAADEAVAQGVVDLIAANLPELLGKIDGRSIPISSGTVTVSLESPEVRDLDPNFVERALGILSNPNVAFLLFSLGGIAILIEFWTPGTFGPAIVGVILLLLAFAGLAVLPFSWAGVALIVLAMIFFFVESQVPGFGLFGIAGIVSLVLGGMFLVGFFGTPSIPAPSIRVSPWSLVGVAAAAGLIVLWFVRELRPSRKLPGYKTPYAREALVGKVATVTKALHPEGEVSVAGENWTARLPRGQTAPVGADVFVKGVDGLVLQVELTAAPSVGPPRQ
ncbi:MAG: nodulation protein NfeD [Chloroflexi bacterium]|nr:nodulation protein NfeD [Chloroflexota bacterium]